MSYRNTKYDSRTNLYNVLPSSLRITRASLAKIRTGGLAEWVAYGTSLTGGTGANVRANAWPTQLQSLLSSQGYASGGSGFIGGQSSTTPTDSRVTLSGWTAFAANQSHLIQTTTNGSTATFADTQASTIVDIWYLDIGGSFTYSIDGGAPVTVTPPGGPNTTPRKVTVSGLASANHTVVITNTAANGTSTYVLGVSFKRVAGLIIHNLGIGGQGLGNINGVTVGYSPASLHNLIAPALTFLEIGTNDSASAGTSSWTTPQQTFITRTLGFGDIVLVTEPPKGDPTLDPNCAVMQGQTYGLADANGIAAIDWFDRLGTYTGAKALGMTNNDQVHFNEIGYADMSRAALGVTA